MDESDVRESITAMIEECAAARRAQWKARWQAKTQARVERKAARDAGLIARHARKLARLQAGPSTT